MPSSSRLLTLFLVAVWHSCLADGTELKSGHIRHDFDLVCDKAEVLPEITKLVNGPSPQVDARFDALAQEGNCTPLVSSYLLHVLSEKLVPGAHGQVKVFFVLLKGEDLANPGPDENFYVLASDFVTTK